MRSRHHQHLSKPAICVPQGRATYQAVSKANQTSKAAKNVASSDKTLGTMVKEDYAVTPNVRTPAANRSVLQVSNDEKLAKKIRLIQIKWTNSFYPHLPAAGRLLLHSTLCPSPRRNMAEELSWWMNMHGGPTGMADQLSQWTNSHGR